MVRDRRAGARNPCYARGVISDRAGTTAETLPQLWRVRDMLYGIFVVVFSFVALGLVIFATRSDGGANPGAAGFALIGFEFILGGTVLVMARRRGLTMADLGFVRPRVWRPLVVAWFGAYVILIAYGAVILLLDAIGLPVGALDDGNTVEFDQDRNLVFIVLLGIAVTVGAPFGEELLFRGLLFRGLRGYWRFIPAMAISGLLFGIFHVNPSVLVPFAFVGALFAWAYEESGSLWTTIAAHAGVNSVSFIVTVALLE